jgi:hypothetical protein
MGLWSTPLLHLYCEQNKRLLYSYDTDKKWFDENKNYDSKYHKVLLSEEAAWETLVPWLQWSIVFIDQRPAGDRQKAMEYFANQSLFVVIHDSEPEQDKFYRYSRKYDLYKYRYDMADVLPNTTVLSNAMSPAILLC